MRTPKFLHFFAFLRRVSCSLRELQVFHLTRLGPSLCRPEGTEGGREDQQLPQLDQADGSASRNLQLCQTCLAPKQGLGSPVGASRVWAGTAATEGAWHFFMPTMKIPAFAKVAYRRGQTDSLSVSLLLVRGDGGFQCDQRNSSNVMYIQEPNAAEAANVNQCILALYSWAPERS